MEHGAISATSEPRRCVRCDKDALTVDDAGMALCARHATIFLTVARMAAEQRGTGDALERSELTPA